MFTKAITGLDITSWIGNDLCSNITTNRYYADDESFLATLRVILHKRMPPDSAVRLNLSKSAYSRDSFRNVPARNCVAALVPYNMTNVLHISNLEGSTDGVSASFEQIDEHLNEVSDNKYTALKDVEAFIEKSCSTRARVYISEEMHTTLIAVEHLNLKTWHMLQSLLPRYFPWYMKDAPLDEEETELLRSLTKRYAPEYIRRISELTRRFDSRSARVRKLLGKFEKQLEQKKLSGVQSTISQNEYSLAQLDEQARNLYRALDALRAQETGLLVKIRDIGDGESGLMEYFLCNKNMDIISVEGGIIEFVVNTTISSFDPDLVEGALARFGKSFFYRHYRSGTRYENEELTDERIRRLMTAIFLDEELKLRVCAAYRMDCSGGGLSALRDYTFSEETLATHTPNQHIQYYACLGNNGPLIDNAVRRRDYVGAAILCNSSASNINFTEANTGTFFMEKICATDVGEIIEMPDGSTKTPLDAVKWLEARDAEKEQEKAKEAAENEQTD